MSVKTITHYGNDVSVEPKVGHRVKIGDTFFKLVEGVGYVDSGFAGCQFYAEAVNTNIPMSLAVNIEVTGRTIQHMGNNRTVKVRLEFVGDCEPSTFTSALLLIDSAW